MSLPAVRPSVLFEASITNIHRWSLVSFPVADARTGSSLPKAGEYLYAFRVGTKAALILGGGGITGGMYELGALSALDDFIVSGRRSGEFDLYVGISAGSILAAFLANGITVRAMCSAVLGEGDQGFFLRREDIYELPIGNLFRFLGRSLRSLGSVVRHIRKSGQAVTFLNILSILQQFLPAGFFSNANLERYVARTLSGEGRTTS
jgi:NTE family protein